MEEIVKTTRYWLFKKSEIHDDYYYVRIKTDNVKGVIWSLGYKNRLGLVSCIGGELDSSLCNTLETEFQIERDIERKENMNYKVNIHNEKKN